MIEDLRAWRRRHGLTQLEAARRVGRARRTWQEWEYGEAPLPLGLMALLREIELADTEAPLVGDLWECPTCKAQIVVGVAPMPVREHFEAGFDAVVECTKATQLLVKDC